MLQKIVCFHIQVVFAQLYCYDHRESDDAIVTVNIMLYVRAYIMYVCMPCVRVHACMCACVCAYMYVDSMYVCMYVCMCAFARMRVCVRLCVYLYVRLCIPARTYVCVSSCVFMYVYVCN